MFRELARIKQKISEEECIEVLKNETRGVLSVLGDDDYPYGMPMNHWYDERDGKIYFHCGKKGHRLDAIQKNNKVSFCVYDHGFRKEGEWALNVKSVIIFGRIAIIDDIERIADITAKLSRKFTQDEAYIQSEIEKRYGFVYVNADSHGNGDYSRVKKKSFEWYKTVIQTNGLALYE